MHDANSRLWPGAHGNRTSLLQAAVARTSTFTFGPQQPAHVHRPSTLDLRLHPSSGRRIRKNSSPRTATPTITFPCGHTPHCRRFTTFQLTTCASFPRPSHQTGAWWPPAPVTKTSNSGKSGNPKLLPKRQRRIVTRAARLVVAFVDYVLGSYIQLMYMLSSSCQPLVIVCGTRAHSRVLGPSRRLVH